MKSFKIISQNLQSQVNILEGFRKKLLIKYWFIKLISYLIFFYLAYIFINNKIDLVDIFNSLKEIIARANETGLSNNFVKLLFKSKNSLFLLDNIIFSFIFVVSCVSLIKFAISLILYYIRKCLDILITCVSKWIFNYDFKYIKLFIDYKEKIIRELISFLGEKLDYSPDKKIEKDLFLESSLYSGPFDSYYGDDYVEGYIDKTKIMFSELRVWKKVNKESKKVFQGLLFIADFNKNFSYKTIVREKNVFKIFKLFNFILNKILRNFDLYLFLIFFISSKFKFNLIISVFTVIVPLILWIIFKMVIKPRLGKAKLENMDFESLYDVYGDNQQELRYLLTPNLMEKLVDLQLNTENKINISFVNSKIFIAIPFNGPLFEPDLFESIHETLEIHYQILELVIGIVEELDLNTRIWTKE